MKASELIHGGLYLIHDTNDVVVRYDIISNSFRSEWYEYPLGLFHDDVCATDGDRYIFVKPIPLTKEMLVNDEFYIAEEASHNAVLKKKTDDALIVVLLIGNSFVLNIERNIEFEGTYAIDKVHKCGYFVHEYQHALRLCDLNDISDNLKLLTK